MSLLSFVPLIGGLLDKIIPDKDARTKAEHELNLLVKNGELELMLKQIEVNANEAKHRSIFIAGWRPCVGWVCALAFSYHFILQPIIVFAAAVAGTNIDLPEFDMGSLLYVLGGMLGLGGFRSFEKSRGLTK
jgi:hypothetical protein